MKKSRNLRVVAEKKVRSSNMELSFIKHREKSFDNPMAPFNKELYAARAEYAASRWNRVEVFSKLKVLETELG